MHAIWTLGIIFVGICESSMCTYKVTTDSISSDLVIDTIVDVCIPQCHLNIVSQ